MVVAIAGFFRVDELRRFAHLRRSAIVLSLVALVGVLVLGVLSGLLLAAGLSLAVLVQRLSRPSAATLARDPETGVRGHADRHPGWSTVPGVLVARSDGPLFYANAVNLKDRLLAAVTAEEPRPHVVVLDLAESADLDVETLDTLAELRDTLSADGIELRLAAVRTPALELLRRSGLAARVRIDVTLDAAVSASPDGEATQETQR